nr:histone-lysine n-methyltransferase atxr3 [Quercus suber]
MVRRSHLIITLLQRVKKNTTCQFVCGSQFFQGSYLNLTGKGAFQKISIVIRMLSDWCRRRMPDQVLDEWRGILDCHQLMLEACELYLVSEDNYLDLGRAGLGSCLLGRLPDWVVAYSACLVGL